jgi:hypothetical protein
MFVNYQSLGKFNKDEYVGCSAGLLGSLTFDYSSGPVFAPTRRGVKV